MKRCEAMIDAGRRKFLTGAGVVAVGAATATVAVPEAKAAPSPARVVYPSNRLANIRDLKVDDPLRVSYPDSAAASAPPGGGITRARSRIRRIANMPRRCCSRPSSWPNRRSRS